MYFDAAPLGAQVEETPAGGLRIPSHVTRVGVFEYRLTDGTTRREYRPPAEVFAAESLATYRDAAVCVGHPDLPIDGRSWSGVAVGHVSGEATPDGAFVLADVVVSDGETIAAVRARELVEVSCGYRADLDPTPGMSPEGEAYDGIQRNIRINHVGLGPRGWGRGGPEVRLLADSKTAIVEADSMSIEELKARAEKAEARADALANEIAVRASERADLITVARGYLGSEYLRDKKDAAAASNEDILMAILKQACPGCDFSGKSPDFLYGALYAVTMAKAAPEAEEPAAAPEMDALEVVPAAEDKPAPLAPEMPVADMCGPEEKKMSADSRVFVVDHRTSANVVDPIAELRKRNANAWRIK